MIRLLTTEDFALWKAIRLEAVRGHPEAFGSTYEESLLAGDSEWAQSLKNNFIFAYLDKEHPVGVAGYFFKDATKLRHRGRIFTAYVHKDYRGKGIMDWLLGAIGYHARDNGIEQLHLDVGTYNENALRCYERNGFAVYGTEPRALKLGGEYIDEYLMVKYL
jgi:RimJ/RimL family protein N-acetyltransferase